LDDRKGFTACEKPVPLSPNGSLPEQVEEENLELANQVLPENGH